MNFLKRQGRDNVFFLVSVAERMNLVNNTQKKRKICRNYVNVLSYNILNYFLFVVVVDDDERKIDCVRVKIGGAMNCVVNRLILQC